MVKLKSAGAGLGLMMAGASMFGGLPNLEAGTADGGAKAAVTAEVGPPLGDTSLDFITAPFAAPFDADPRYNEGPLQAASIAGWLALGSIIGAAAGKFVEDQTKG